ncbi:MAG TPA: HAMP domain-containing sensor histidine kinase [bacterium]|nr:HAMP domain-containing sensor histidine kinase [bacterium]
MGADFVIDPDTTETQFLPARREHQDTIARQHATVLRASFIEVMEDMPMLALAVNETRQIVWSNRKAQELAGLESSLGLRPGEALRCIHASEKIGGCGTTSFCAFCGAPPAIMKALAGATGTEPCAIQRNIGGKPEVLDLLLWSRPLDLEGERFVIIIGHDVSVHTRQEALERVFYHDIGNTVAGIRAIVDLMEDEGHPTPRYMSLLRSAADQLLEEIDSQRALKAAEEGSLNVEKTLISLRATIERAIGIFDYSIFGKDIRIALENTEGLNPAGDAEVMTDPIILRRVLVNMLKNAMEASGRNDTIRIWFSEDTTSTSVHVWNAAILSRESMTRVFQRSYSTKGHGRGFGTYGMKMLAERFLGGHVGFISEEGTGTIFTVTLPKYTTLP